MTERDILIDKQGVSEFETGMLGLKVLASQSLPAELAILDI